MELCLPMVRLIWRTGRAVPVMTTQDEVAPQSKRWRWLSGGLVIVLVIVYLIASSARGTAVYALTIHELKARGSAGYGQGVRVGGTVDGSSIAWDAERQVLMFNIADDEESLAVVYQGSRPDMFRDGAQALVEGKYQETGVFVASKLLLKCPSKYEAAATQTVTG
jgi:cytochrome c-type biogenesis protein CcmE